MSRPPEGVETVRVYRCRECGALTTKDIHCYVKGPPLIPQMDDYSLCDPVDAVPLPVFLAEREARELAERERDELSSALSRVRRITITEVEKRVRGLVPDDKSWTLTLTGLACEEAARERDAAVARAEQAEAERDRLKDALEQLGAEILNNRDRTARGEPKGWQAALDFICARAALSPDPSGETEPDPRADQRRREADEQQRAYEAMKRREADRAQREYEDRWGR